MSQRFAPLPPSNIPRGPVFGRRSLSLKPLATRRSGPAFRGRSAAAADYYDIRNTYDDHRELLAAGVDGVVVAVQHAYHYEVARDALDAGVHVLVEKPMTLTAADAWDLVERAKSNGLHLMVGYTSQFTRHADAARESSSFWRWATARQLAGARSR